GAGAVCAVRVGPIPAVEPVRRERARRGGSGAGPELCVFGATPCFASAKHSFGAGNVDAAMRTADHGLGVAGDGRRGAACLLGGSALRAFVIAGQDAGGEHDTQNHDYPEENFTHGGSSYKMTSRTKRLPV